jgi:hypothetical protein
MFITVEEIRELSSFDEVRALSDTQLNRYIDRADGWIRRATNNVSIGNSEVEALQKDMGIATWLLVEYLWYWDNPESKETLIAQDDDVRLGSYSYSFKPVEGSYVTGIKELDDILKTWKYTFNAGNIFRVSGPSRM